MGAQSGRTYAIGSTQQVRTPAKRITLDLRDVPLREALNAVEAQGGISLAYASGTVPLDRRITVRLSALSVDEALRVVLRGIDVEIRESGSGQVMLVKRMSRQEDGASAAESLGALMGQVVDATTKGPVIKALVTLDQGAARATTNDLGQYSLPNVPGGTHKLSVRRIGYAPAERFVTVRDGETTAMDFALTAVASQLDEVVTTVTGVQRRVEVGNAIGVIDAASIVGQSPITDLGQLINARVPGTQVVLNSGFSGSSPRVRIRGINSVTASNDPLLVIDGVRVENSTSEFGGYGQTSGRLNDINPEEIESIEITKGPSAATLYGTDAANGVIVVKTKRGHPGRATWNAYTELGQGGQHTAFPDNYYSWGRNALTGATQQCLLTQLAAQACAIDSLTTFNPLLNAATTPLGVGRREQYGLQASGGTNGFAYFVAGEYANETGPLRMPSAEESRILVERSEAALPDEQLRPNALRRVSLRSNNDVTLGANADFTLSFGLTSMDVRIPSNSIFFDGMSGKGYRDANDGWYGTRPGELFGLRSGEHVTHYTGSLRGNWRPLSWLSTNATAGTDFSTTSLNALQRRGEGPFGASRNGRRQNIRTDAQLNSLDLGASAFLSPKPRLSSRTSMGVQYNRRQLNATTATGTNLSLGSETLAGAAITTGAERNDESVVAGAYAEEVIGLDSRLYITGALRADGATSFGRNFNTAIYPKASASWLAIAQRPGRLNSLRLRAAYGASGVQPTSTAALALVGVFPVLVDGIVSSGGARSAIGNADLKPERQVELESGADIELFAQRLRVEATVYDRLSRDALIDRPLPTSFGIQSRQENIGAVRNRGLEGLVSAHAIDNHNVIWDLALNASVNHNRLERIGASVQYIGTSSYRNQEGYPLFSNWARPITLFDDADGNGIIEADEIAVGDTAVYLGSSLPSRQMTISSTVSLYDRVHVAVQFDYRGGYTQLNTQEFARCSVLLNCAAVNDPTSSPERQAAAVASANALLGYTGFGYVQNASFTRWRELSITIDAPEAFARRVGATRCNVVLAGRNLRLFTSYRGLDPEKNASLNYAEGFNDNPAPPPPRTWSLRINLGL